MNLDLRLFIYVKLYLPTSQLYRRLFKGVKLVKKEKEIMFWDAKVIYINQQVFFQNYNKYRKFTTTRHFMCIEKMLNDIDLQIL